MSCVWYKPEGEGVLEFCCTRSNDRAFSGDLAEESDEMKGRGGEARLGLRSSRRKPSRDQRGSNRKAGERS